MLLLFVNLVYGELTFWSKVGSFLLDTKQEHPLHSGFHMGKLDFTWFSVLCDPHTNKQQGKLNIY